MLGNHQMAVMPILEGLCGQDETVVRDMAVKSLIGIMVNASDADINNYFTPMVSFEVSADYAPRHQRSQLHLPCLGRQPNVQGLQASRPRQGEAAPVPS